MLKRLPEEDGTLGTWCPAHLPEWVAAWRARNGVTPTAVDATPAPIDVDLEAELAARDAAAPWEVEGIELVPASEPWSTEELRQLARATRAQGPLTTSRTGAERQADFDALYAGPPGPVPDPREISSGRLAGGGPCRWRSDVPDRVQVDDSGRLTVWRDGG